MEDADATRADEQAEDDQGHAGKYATAQNGADSRDEADNGKNDE